MDTENTVIIDIQIDNTAATERISKLTKEVEIQKAVLNEFKKLKEVDDPNQYSTNCSNNYTYKETLFLNIFFLISQLTNFIEKQN